MFGPSFTDPIGLTIESCVAFCTQQGSRMAGLKETECRMQRLASALFLKADIIQVARTFTFHLRASRVTMASAQFQGSGMA